MNIGNASENDIFFIERLKHLEKLLCDANDSMAGQLLLDFTKKSKEVDRKAREEQRRKDAEFMVRYNKKIEEDIAAKRREIAKNTKAREAKKFEETRTIREKEAAEQEARNAARDARQSGIGLVGYAKENYERSRQLRAILSREELEVIIFEHVLELVKTNVGSKLGKGPELLNTITKISKNICDWSDGRNEILTEQEQTRAFLIVDKLARVYAEVNVPGRAQGDALRLLELTARKCLDVDPLNNHDSLRPGA